METESQIFDAPLITSRQSLTPQSQIHLSTAHGKTVFVQAGWLAEVDAAFSGTGIKSFVLEGALGELQVFLPLSWYPGQARPCRGQRAAAGSQHYTAAGCTPGRMLCCWVLWSVSRASSSSSVCATELRVSM